MPAPPASSSWFADRSVRTKVLAAVGTLALVAVTVGAVGVSSLRDVEEKADQLYVEGLVPLQLLADANLAQDDSRRETLNVLISETPAEREDNKGDVAGASDRFDQALTQYREHPQTGRAEAVAALLTDWQTYVAYRDRTLVPLAVAGDLAAFNRAQAGISPAMEGVEEHLGELLAIEQADARALRRSADRAVATAVRTGVLTLLVGLVLGLGLALRVVRGITRPLGRVQASLDAMAAGDLTVAVDVHSSDELGRMAAALGRAQAGVGDVVRALSSSARELSGSSDELSAVATQISASAEQSSAQANVVSAAAEQVSRNVQTVATGAEEMGASIREIAQNANEATRVAGTAVTVARDTNATVAKLGDSSREIGEVVKVITSIAEQTNLLALNATIEAARAGEAGKGFAVVANEVKDLAQETARATEDISRRISAIQGDTAGAVDAIGRIAEVIDRIHDYQTTIASAVEEQTATTNEMSRSVAEAATGSTEIAANITGVAQAAASTSDGVGQAQRAAGDLARMSTELQQLVSRFTV